MILDTIPLEMVKSLRPPIFFSCGNKPRNFIACPL